jgi:hypothetical protein
MMGSFSSVVSDSSGCGLQSLVSWKDARMAPDTTTSEQQEIVDLETVDSETRETPDTNNPTQLQTTAT